MRFDRVSESKWTQPTDCCPHPERWHSTDEHSTEVEVTELVAAFVRALQPDLVVETGTAFGQTTEAIGRALESNGQGRLITYEPDLERASIARQRCLGLPVEFRTTSSLDPVEGVATLEPVGFAWLDSLFELRFAELDMLTLTGNAIVGLHDTAPHHPLYEQLDERVGLKRLDLPTPRGVTFLQK